MIMIIIYHDHNYLRWSLFTMIIICDDHCPPEKNVDVKGWGVLEPTSPLLRRDEREWVPSDDDDVDGDDGDIDDGDDDDVGGDDGDVDDDYFNRWVVLNQKEKKSTKKRTNTK